MNNELLSMARKYVDAGLSVVPISRKRPLLQGWTKYGNVTPTYEDLDQWFAELIPTGIGLVANDRMTIYDFEEMEIWHKFKEEAGELLDGIPIEASGKGIHFAFLSDHTLPTCKIAERPNPDNPQKPHLLIETRNKGAQVVVAPSVHYGNDGQPTGKKYKSIRGNLYNLPEIDVARARAIELLARSYNQIEDTTGRKQVGHGTDRPYEESRTQRLFNDKYAVDDILVRNGYQQDRYDKRRYLSPNSTSGSPGIEVQPDGTLFSNHADVLNTTSPEGTRQKHDAFDTFRLLEHGGNYGSAYRAAEGDLGLEFTVKLTDKITHNPSNLPSLPKLLDYDLLATDLPELKFIIPEYLPEGLFILAGKPKLGKSWLALDMCVAVATGGSVLGKKVESAEAVYFGLEDGSRRLKDRLQKLGLHGTMPFGLHIGEIGSLNPLDHGGFAQLDNMLEQMPDVRLVVIDTLGKVKPSVAKKDAYEADVKIMAQLQKIASKHGVGMLLVTHVRKTEAEDAFDQVHGSVGLTGTADGTLLLSRKRGASQATLSITGRDIEEQELAVEFGRVDFKWKVLGEAWKVRAEGDQRKIMDALADSTGAMGPMDLAEATGKTVASVKSMLKTLEKKQLIYKLGHGKYAINTDQQLKIRHPGQDEDAVDHDQIALEV